jgi:hypothetical protein
MPKILLALNLAKRRRVYFLPHERLVYFLLIGRDLIGKAPSSS